MAELSEREKREALLTKMMQTLASNNEATSAWMKTRGIHVTEIKITLAENTHLTGIDKFRQESRDLERWVELRDASLNYSWQEFVDVCAQKIDVTGTWKVNLARSIGVDLAILQFRERYGRIPHEWLTRVADLPDWHPSPDEKRSNFSAVAGELVAALKAAGKKSGWIAEQLTAFLRDYNGTKVSTADVTFS